MVACFRIMHALYVLLGLYAILHNGYKVFTNTNFLSISRLLMLLKVYQLSCFVVFVSLLKPSWIIQFIPDQIRSNWFKSDQIRSSSIKLVQIRSSWIRLIIWFKSYQIGSNQIKLDQIGSRGSIFIFKFVFDYWESWLMLVMLEHVPACCLKN